MIYDIFVNDKLYKTVETEDGYDYKKIMSDLAMDREAGKLDDFIVDGKFSVQITARQ